MPVEVELEIKKNKLKIKWNTFKIAGCDCSSVTGFAACENKIYIFLTQRTKLNIFFINYKNK